MKEMNLFRKKYLFSVIYLLSTYFVIAQFIINESFMESTTNTSVIMGDNAKLTSGNGDPVGNGWLRLTAAENNQKGFAYVDETFPSEQGVTVEFDYKTWRNSSGADGFTVFLFDGSYGTVGNIFKTGSYGGALGYANSSTSTGLTGGYIGIGFDEFGNFASSSESKNGGAGSGLYKNYISIRGKSPLYKYLYGQPYTGIGKGIAYGTTTTVRPTDNQFYRRVKIVISPELGSYRITVSVKRTTSGNYEQQFTTLSTDTPYKLLKIGFAGSTGGSNNNHEIRNVSVRTPGGISIKKIADKTHVAINNATNNKVKYTVTISNFQSANVPDITFTDIIQDINGTKLSSSQFQVDNIALSGFLNNSSSLLTNNVNSISGTLGLEKYKEGIITIEGTYLGNSIGNRIQNTVTANSASFVDDNLDNNTAVNFVDILKTNDDLFKWNNKNLLVLTNDTYDGLGTPITLTGSTINSTLSQIGTWPTGITLNSTTGEVIVANGTSMPLAPLQYQLCTSSGTCSISSIKFFDAENDISVSGVVTNQCGYNSVVNNYTLTVTNNLPYAITTSPSEKIQIAFNVDNNVLNSSKLESFSTSLGDNDKWTQTETGKVTSYDYVFTLKDNTIIPANGSVTLQFSKDWNKSLDINGSLENPINSLNVDLKYLNASNQNIDKKLTNNTLFISVFRLATTSVPSVTTKVNQGKVITVGEAANLGPNTSGYKFYINNGTTEVSSNYLIPTHTNQPFSFSYKSDCAESKVTVNVEVGFPNPGTISLTNGSMVDSIFTCYDGSVTVYENTAASHSLTLSFNYYWELSYDGGLTWLKESSAVGDDGSSSTSNGRKSITIDNIKKQVKVRRYAKPLLLNSVAAYSNEVTINTTQNEIKFDKGVNSFAIQEYITTLAGSGKFIIPAGITTTEPSDVVITKSDGSVVTPGQELTGLTAGEYEFTVTATTKTGAAVVGCITSTKFKLIVYSLANCNVATKKIFATHQQMWTSGLSGVADPERAVNGDRSQYATLTGGVVLLGIGTVGIDLYFTKPNGTLYTATELKGKKVTIKLGEQYSGLKIAGGVTVVGRNINSLSDISRVVPVANTGFTYGVKGGLLDALKGDNVFEFSFVPSQSNGTPVDFNGIRIQLGSLLGVADLATVFHAYIEEDYTVNPATPETPSTIQVTPPASLIYPTEQRDIDGTMITGIKNTGITLNNFTDDVTWGNRSEVLNVASGLSSVVHPYYAVDNNYDSYTLFNSTAGVLNQQFLRTHLRQVARPGDQIQITLAYPNINVLNLSLLQLGNFKIVYYLGDVEVGSELMEEFRVLDIGLFNFKNKRRAVISKPIKIPFDSFEIQQFNTVSVNLGDGLHIHDIRVAPMMLFNGQLDPKEVTPICAADFLGIQSPDFCTDYAISFAKIISFGDAYTNTDGSPLLDKEGNPIKMITAVEDIPNSELTYSHIDGSIKYYTINQLYTEHEIEGIILVKVQTMRQGSNYGDPQYLRVKLSNCNEAIVNPVIKLNTNK